MLEGVWLVHPDDAMCEEFQRRFAGLRGVRGRFSFLSRPINRSWDQLSEEPNVAMRADIRTDRPTCPTLSRWP